MKVGDLVAYKEGKGVLRSGCGWYDSAIVVSLSPFCLISKEGDMLWRATVRPEDFDVIGKPRRKELLACIKRLYSEMET